MRHVIQVRQITCHTRPYKHPSDDEEEEEGEQGEETIPKLGKASSVAEALADAQAKLKAQSNKTPIRRRSEIEGREC